MAPNQLLLAALAGVLVIVAASVAWRLSQRQFARELTLADPVVPAGVASVLSVLRSSAIVVDPHDVVLRASAPAYALGLVNGNAVTHSPLLRLITEVRRDSQIREREFELLREHGRPARTVAARVAPLGSNLIVALVEDRTRERRLDAVRRDFVANVSHELKTPVGAIRLLAEAVQGGADDPAAVHRFAGRMLTESDRLSKLVAQIIELSRLQGDDPIEEPSTVQVDQVVAAAIDANVIDAEAKSIEIVLDGDRNRTVLGGHAQVIIAISNLIANAVSYSSPDSTVVVRVTERAESVDISVIDQGIGIPSAEMDRIFERFYRVDPARHRSTGGTGLGLSIVKHVAATHGGQVRAWSVEGQGSTFTLSLPGPAYGDVDYDPPDLAITNGPRRNKRAARPARQKEGSS
ncbi:MAG: sensor histidine kinase [Nocardioides sp.]